MTQTSVSYRGVLSVLLALGVQPAGAAPTVVETTVLGPFTGDGAQLHPDNLSPNRIAYYGTDLGWSYEHDGRLQFLFGDTMATEAGERIEASTGETFDDAYGSVDLERWPDASVISADNMPLLYLGQHAASTEAAAINPGHALESFKTPIGGFSSGAHEFAIFYLAKPQACLVDADCGAHLVCDQALGYTGEAYSDERGITLACRDGSSPNCIADTMSDANSGAVPGSGLCSDPTSSVWAETDMGRASAAAVKLLIGVRDTADRRRYAHTQVWLTNKFSNSTFRTVERFEPVNAATDSSSDFQPARGNRSGRRVFIWGRPGFVGVGKRGRPLGLYFGYVDMPAGEDFVWEPRYFAGIGDGGVPRFSGNERDAVALDLDATRSGVQADAEYDVVDQVSVAWVEHLDKWLMFYGGGMIDLPITELPDCGVLQLFTGPECKDVDLDNGAFRMRTADHPWGPWSPPQDLIVAGDPAHPKGQYGIGGMLRHPQCTSAGCAPHTDARDTAEDEYGFFYAANIIAEWIAPVGDGVDVIWNASTWDPYRVILLRTRINR